MQAASNAHLALLKKNHIFQGVNEEDLQQILAASSERVLAPGEYLVEEGSQANSIFIIVHGQVEIVKAYGEPKTVHRLTTLSTGDTVGEIAFIDQGVRSAGVRALTPTTALRIPVSALHRLQASPQTYQTLLAEIAKGAAQRLRAMNTTTTIALQQALSISHARLLMGKMIIHIVVILSLLMFSVSGLSILADTLPHTTYVTLPLGMIIALSVALVLRATGLPWREFGMTTQHWRRACVEAILWTLPILLLISLAKGLMIAFIPYFQGKPLFALLPCIDPTMCLASQLSFTHWLMLIALYVFLVCPVQEFIVRSGLQVCLTRFLPGKHNVLAAILVSNLIFASAHLFISLPIAILSFFPGLFLGWLFHRQHSLIGVTVAHAMIGIWSLSVLQIGAL